MLRGSMSNPDATLRHAGERRSEKALFVRAHDGPHARERGVDFQMVCRGAGDVRDSARRCWQQLVKAAEPRTPRGTAGPREQGASDTASRVKLRRGAPRASARCDPGEGREGPRATTFLCGLCSEEHDVAGSCMLPCGHRFCFERLGSDFAVHVQERRLDRLRCPVEDCQKSLDSDEHTHLLKDILPQESYQSLLRFLALCDHHVVECGHACGEAVWIEEGDDVTNLTCAAGHRFCGSCAHGPHPGQTCLQRGDAVARDGGGMSPDTRRALGTPCFPGKLVGSRNQGTATK